MISEYEIWQAERAKVAAKAAQRQRRAPREQQHGPGGAPTTYVTGTGPALLLSALAVIAVIVLVALIKLA